jgi:integrase
MLQSHVVKRGSQFYFRIAVPSPLTKIVGKREIKASLRTSDAMSAKMRGRVLSNGLELLFREMRSMANVSNDVILNRAKDYFKTQLSKYLELALLLPTDPLIDLDFEITGTKQLTTELREELKKQHFSLSVQSDARALLNPTNPDIQIKPSDAFRFACNAVLRAKIESTRILAAQLAGEYHEAASKDPWFAGMAAVDLPPIPGDETTASPTCPTFGSVAKQFYAYKSKNDWAAKTAADVKRVIALATELIGADKSMASLGIDDVKSVRDALASVPPNYMKMAASKGISVKEAVHANLSGASLSVKTQDKYFTMFRQILIWASNEGYLDKVPGPNVKVAGVKKLAAGEHRDPYSRKQLVSIFKSPLYTGHKSEAIRHKPGQFTIRDGYFWVPLIALYSGMRMGEILQLLKTDVKLQSGIWHFDVSAGEEKSLKTSSSKRRVPVHKTLVGLGFLDHAKACPGGRLFPEIKKGKDGYYSHNFSKWWGRYSRQTGFKSSKSTFHSFRHNFMDALRAAELPEYVNKALAGHTDNSVHSQYGSGETLSQLKASIDQVSYDIDFSELWKSELQ